jgi:hypothetical protein
MNAHLDPDVVSIDEEPTLPSEVPYEPTDDDYKEAHYWRCVWDMVDIIHERGALEVQRDINKALENYFSIKG